MLRTYREWRMRQAARADAEHGVQAEEDRLTEILGTRPTWQVRDNQRHAQIGASLKKAAALEEVKGDRETSEEHTRRHGSRVFLKMGLIGAVLAEWIGSTWVLGGLGLETLERTVLGLFLALALIGITVQLVKSQPEEGPASEPPPVTTRFRLFLGLYGLVIAALAILRLEEQSAELSRAGMFAQAVLMVAISIGPAWASEKVLRKLRPAEHDHIHWQRLRRRERELSREVRRAEAFTAGMSVRTQRFDEKAARLRAIYRVAHRLASADRAPSEFEPVTVEIITPERNPS
jgi:hypothetical protein